MNKDWWFNLQEPYFPVEIWRHRNGTLSINLRAKIEGKSCSKTIKVFSPEDEDFKIVLDLWRQQQHNIWADKAGFKKWWEFWK